LFGSNRLAEAEKESQQSMDILEKLKTANDLGDPESFGRAITTLANNYMYMADLKLKSGALKDAGNYLKNISILLPDIPKTDRESISSRSEELAAKVFKAVKR
jgi:hypothetical protein